MSIQTESERRQATVMFADVTGFTAMSEKMDPEEVTSIMNDCFDILGSVVHTHEGTIDKTSGDCIMALYGLPTAIEDAPQKAVNTAIEMRNQLIQFNKNRKLEIQLDIHIGINTGMVVAETIWPKGEKDYSVMGDTVNLASRLEEVSETGQIFVGPLTYRYTRTEFEYRPIEPITLKGKEQPIRVFELLSRKEKIYRAGLGTERMIYSEMVGRDKELARLELHLHKAINGEGSIVSIIGDAGIGKSRLIAELRKTSAINTMTYLEGRALSMGKNLSFHPILDLLRHWTGIKEDDPLPESIQKLETLIRNIDPEMISEILPFVATLMGLRLTRKYAERVEGIEGEALEKLILKNVRSLIAKAAEHSPVVFVMEDFHWADKSSIELLESLYRLAENLGILFISVFRPGYEDTGDRILKTIGERYSALHTEIYLLPMSGRESKMLITNLINNKDLPAHVTKLIAEKAEGNPFFIEEVGRSLIDDGAIVIRNGQFKITNRIDSVVIPETIQGVLMARIDRLDESTKSLLKMASVIGRSFFHRILAEVAKMVDELDERIDELKGAQLILEREKKEELEYLFKHALAQETTYESILLQKRKELHLDIANAVELLFSERLHEFYGMLALHYNRGDNLAKAEEYLIKAGEEALKAAASSEAISYYQNALELYLQKQAKESDSEKVAYLRKNIAVAHFNKGHMFEAVEYFDLVLDFYGEKRSRHRVIQALNLISNLTSVCFNLYSPIRTRKRIPSKHHTEMVNLIYRRAQAFATTDANRFFIDSIGLLRLLNRFDISKVENGSYMYFACSGLFFFPGLSFKISKRIQYYAKNYLNTDDLKTTFAFRFYELLHNYLASEWEQVPIFDCEGFEHNIRIGELWHTATYAHWYSLLQTGRGDFSEAEANVARVAEIADAHDYDYARSCRYVGLTTLLLARRNLSTALIEAKNGILHETRIGQDLQTLKITGIMARVQIHQKDFEAAETSLLKAKQFALKEKRIAPYYMSSYLMAQLMFDLHLLEKVANNDKSMLKHKRTLAHKSCKAALANSRKYAADRTETLRLIGCYHWLNGNQKRALSSWRKSISTGDLLGSLPELARTYVEIGKRLLESQSKYEKLNSITAEGYLEKARTCFKEMNLKWDLNELEKIEYARK
jgi:class 3 adenylate cyclase/tetratricopeptide (TPR) repeat protein